MVAHGNQPAPDISRIVADSCAEVPTPDIVAYNIRRLRQVGYLPRFDGYLRQLGFTGAERASIGSASTRDVTETAHAVASREPWGERPDAHLSATSCRLATCITDSAESTIGVPSLPTLPLLDFYASLTCPVRLFVGIDPWRPASLGEALATRGHASFAGLAVMPYLAGVPLSDEIYAPVVSAAATMDLPLWVHSSTHFRADVAYDVGHPRHIDLVLMRHPELRLLIGHAGWPWVAEACAVVSRFANAAIEFSTFPPKVLTDPGWSLTSLLSRRTEFRGRIFFGSGAVSAVQPFVSRLRQLDELPLGDQHDDWRGAGFLSWMRLA
jgi:hypothetical protein